MTVSPAEEYGIKYLFKTTPYAHQLEVLREFLHREYFALFMEMGTGKSKVVLDKIGFLYAAGKISGVLVIAPKGVYSNWPQVQIPKHFSGLGHYAKRSMDIDADLRTETASHYGKVHLAHEILQWTSSSTIKYNLEVKRIMSHTNLPKGEEGTAYYALKFFVMNIEALSKKRGIAVARQFLQAHHENMVVIDESTSIKNKDAKRTANILSLRPLSKYRCILTGSPVTKGPVDLWSQCEFLSKGLLGTPHYYNFINRYANYTRKLAKGGKKSYIQIDSFKRLDELASKIKPFSSRVLKKECLDIPDKTYVTRRISFSPEQKKHYKSMQKNALILLDSGQMTTLTSKLTQILRLQQICAGFVKPDNEEIVPLQQNPRITELLDILEECQGKVIIWASFTYSIQQIVKAISEVKKWGPHSVAAYYGQTSTIERPKVVDRFEDANNPLRFFVGQPKTGGFGITLNKATTVIYFSNSYDLEARIQSEDRAHRMGQNKKVTYIDIIVPGTVDEKILQVLKNKSMTAEKVIGDDPRSWFSWKDN